MSENESQATAVATPPADEKPKAARGPTPTTLSKALAQLQEGGPIIVGRDGAAGTGPKVMYKYSTLGAALEVILPRLQAVGLVLRRQVRVTGGVVSVECWLELPGTGEATEPVVVESEVDTSGRMNALQCLGSTITYVTRYAVMACTGAVSADEDDDGHRGGARNEPLPAQLPPTQRQAAPPAQRDIKPVNGAPDENTPIGEVPHAVPFGPKLAVSIADVKLVLAETNRLLGDSAQTMQRLLAPCGVQKAAALPAGKLVPFLRAARAVWDERGAAPQGRLLELLSELPA